MIEYWDYWFDGYEPPSGGSGYASTLPVDPASDVLDRLHAAVEEVTGSPVQKPERQRMGFL